MYRYIYIHYIYLHTHTHTHTHIYINIYIYIYICVYMCVCVCIHTYICLNFLKRWQDSYFPQGPSIGTFGKKIIKKLISIKNTGTKWIK